MNVLNFRLSLFFSFFIACFFLSALSLFAAIEFSEDPDIRPQQRAPQGSRVAVYEFKLKATGQDETFSEIELFNDGEVGFGNGVKGVYIYQDGSDLRSPNGVFDIDDDNGPIGQEEFESAETGTIAISVDTESISSGNSETFFVVYEFESDARIELTALFNLVSVSTNEGSTVDLEGVDTTNVITVSGIESATAVDVAPSIVLPGQELVPMLRLDLKVGGENLEDDIVIRIKNDASNFSVTTDNEDTDGIVRAHLYRQEFQGEDFNETEDKLIQTITNKDLNDDSNFVSTTELIFDPIRPNQSVGDRLTAGVTRSYFVVYEIGDDFDVDEDTEISAQLIEFSGQGASSGELMSASSLLPSPTDPATSFVAGLAFEELVSIVPPGDTFGQGNLVPMLRINFRAFHIPVTLNEIEILNEQTVPFITDEDDNSGVTRVRLFLDSDGDESFDGLDSSDLEIADLALGTGSNQDDLAVLDQLNDGNGVTIDVFDEDENYPANNESVIFVVYDIGSGSLPDGDDGTGTVASIAEARLADAIGLANVDNEEITMDVRGTLPASASPNAQVDLTVTNIYIEDIEDIAPATVNRGEVKVPMLYITLQADLPQGAFIQDSIVSILNEQNSFLPNNTGATRIWLYSDEDGDRELDDADTLLSSVTVTRNSSRSIARLSGVDFANGEHRLLVLYDIGQIAELTSGQIRSQLLNIEGDGDANVIFGGEVPSPKEAASVGVENASFTITDLDATFNEDEGLSATFNLEMLVNNVSSDDLLVISALPRVYHSSVSGVDISSEFNIETSEIFPVNVPSETTLTVNFQMKHRDRLSEGQAVIDGFAHYSLGGVREAVVNRYQGVTNFESAAEEVVDITLLSSIDPNPWDLPPYIDSMFLLLGNDEDSFTSGTAVPANSSLKIVFRHQGKNLDEGTLRVELNGVDLRRSSTSGDLETDEYSYDEEEGIIIVEDLGNVDGTLTINIADLEGNAMDAAEIEFLTSGAEVRIEDLLFYPNPFQLGVERLKLGFNMTRTGRVTVYIYNYQGQNVLEQEFAISSIGYQLLEFDAFANFLNSGMYICKVVAKDDNGNDDEAVTRLAVY